MWFEIISINLIIFLFLIILFGIKENKKKMLIAKANNFNPWKPNPFIFKKILYFMIRIIIGKKILIDAFPFFDKIWTKFEYAKIYPVMQ